MEQGTLPVSPAQEPDRSAKRRVRDSALVRKPFAFYERHGKYAPLLFFFGGVAWDALTLTRIDRWTDNLILLGYLLVLGALIVVATLVAYGRVQRAFLLKGEPYYPAALQFFMGALFSSYVVFYAQSASFSETSLFLVLLVGLLVANEFIHRRLLNLYVLVALYYLAAFSYFIFAVPVVLREMNFWTFLGGGALALMLVTGLLVLLKRNGVLRAPRQFPYALGLATGMFALFNVFYVMNWIPPVPLALRFGGVYHQVTRQADGAYALRFEQPAPYRFWARSDARFHHAPGDTVYAFAAVFAPTHLRKQVYHDWQWYDPVREAWVTTDRIRYEVTGGRREGYRGKTLKRNVRPGRWRVEVETEDGRILGRIAFEVESVEAPVTAFKTLIYR